MYLVFADKGEEFSRIRATLGALATNQVGNRHELISALQRDPHASILIFAPGIRSESVFEIATELQMQYPALSVILIRNHIDVPTLSAALECGIKDVIDGQDATGLINAIQRCEAISERLSNQLKDGAQPKRGGKLVAVFSAKGGCGKTTVASNLAAVLAEQNQVCLVDLDLEFGDIATIFGMAPTKNLSHILELDGALDSEGITSMLTRVEDGFDALFAPSEPGDTSVFTPTTISRVLGLLQSRYDYVVVDTSPTMSTLIRHVLLESDLVLLLTTLDMPAIKNLKIVLSILNGLGLATERRMVVLNRAEGKVGLAPHDVEELIGEPISVTIPSSLKVSASANEGRLLVSAHRHNVASKALYELARVVANT
jgi:pilus assembly protein CpaE